MQNVYQEWGGKNGYRIYSAINKFNGKTITLMCYSCSSWSAGTKLAAKNQQKFVVNKIREKGYGK